MAAERKAALVLCRSRLDGSRLAWLALRVPNAAGRGAEHVADERAQGIPEGRYRRDSRGPDSANDWTRQSQTGSPIVTAARCALTYWGFKMRKSYVAFAFAAFTFAQPAAAVTFPTLTTIYVGSGVVDTGDPNNSGVATSILCSNVSGVSVQLRVLILRNNGAVANNSVTQTVAHGASATFSTHETAIFVDGGNSNLSTGSVEQGTVNVEATNSAVFCTAAVLDAQGLPPVFTMPLHLVRVNPHPGTVE